MTDPIHPATIARLRELIAAAGEWPNLEPEDQSDGSFRCPLCDGQGDIDAEFVKDGRREYGNDAWFSIVGVQVYGVGDAMAAMETLLPLLIRHAPSLLDQLAAQAEIADKLNREIDSIQDQWKAERSTTEAKLAAQAAEIERLKKDWTFLLGQSKEGARIAGCALVERDEARARVAELERELACLAEHAPPGHSLHSCGGPQEACMQPGCTECGTPTMEESLTMRARVAELEGLLREAVGPVRGLAHGLNYPPLAQRTFMVLAGRIDAALAKREGGR